MLRSGLEPGFALDLKTSDENGVAWDFDKDKRESAARIKLETDKPDLLAGSPMCIMFSPLQRMCPSRLEGGAEWTNKTRKTEAHMKFVCDLHRIQQDAGRYFLHEYRLQADSWDLPCIKAVLALDGVGMIELDQCQYGQQDDEGNPIKEPTR